ncbi:SDR family NAD(P)-dependent oxidoreductase [Citricoccus sp. NR2]|uniref:SDR family NAD(P)-dependent oxidoreductase n=1 Tax=Citricoccus sp. NR2 TaxID=3004095 RepID=UPI0022DE3715|nr:SDR family NAD(P)-dependent oxidoreductase [Citricoccus sp. NR2]WBL20249.1 SDR family NAD(P)-dependent oxidoreductase [Citricoccus sp. NR2]
MDDSAHFRLLASRVETDSLTGRTAVVTGAGRGLGRAYAFALAAAGAHVIVNDVDEAAAHRVVDDIREARGQATAHIAAIGPLAAAEQLVQTAVEHTGRLDIMVANAGVLRDRVVWKMAEEDFDLVVSTHLKGAWTCAKAAAEQFREQGDGGRVILVGSPAGQYGSFGQSNYSSAKAGVVGLARTLSLELARFNITVNAIIPTALTEMTATIPAYSGWVKDVEAGRDLPPLARREHGLGSTIDVAPLVTWLASDDAAGVSGQALGLGGDRIIVYAHPREEAIADRDGGWSQQDISDAWHRDLSRAMQPAGPPEKPSPENW